MSQRSERERARLEAVERWHSMQLEEAQATHSELSKVASSKQEALDELAQMLDSAQVRAREQLQRGTLCLDELMRHSEFVAHQSVEIVNAQAEVESAEKAAEEAQGIVRERFQRVSVLEKLLERKAAEDLRLALQAEQKRLDDDALLRIPAQASELEKEE
ncbi:MAG TPA: flagellar FliJ family protein [Steroidobacteraceae bacterium]|nr:flagellar FliJ family protein [Steroidobacteraceae bacterium]